MKSIIMNSHPHYPQPPYTNISITSFYYIPTYIVKPTTPLKTLHHHTTPPPTIPTIPTSHFSLLTPPSSLPKPKPKPKPIFQTIKTLSPYYPLLLIYIIIIIIIITITIIIIFNPYHRRTTFSKKRIWPL